MVPQTKVFVGSLPPGSKPDELRKLFERFGVVTECDIMNRCGFVHMQSEEQASAAIRALHNSTFNGGVITVERGRIKERGQRGGGGGRGRGGGRGGPGPMRGGHPRGPPRDAPYGMRDGRGRGGDGRGPGGGMMRGGMPPPPYERMDRAPGDGYDDRYNGYGGEDRRGFALMDGRARDPYAAPPAVYDDRRGYGGAVDELPPMYPEERRPVYDDRDVMDRRPPMRGPMPPAPAPYERPAPPPRHPHHMPNGDLYSRRSPMRGGAMAGGYDRDPYAQQYAPMPPRAGGGGGRGGRDYGGGMGPRRY